MGDVGTCRGCGKHWWLDADRFCEGCGEVEDQLDKIEPPLDFEAKLRESQVKRISSGYLDDDGYYIMIDDEPAMYAMSAHEVTAVQLWLQQAIRWGRIRLLE